MPTISLRLTTAEHEQLRQEAYDSRRSMQQEIIYRLFVEGPAEAILQDGPENYELQPEETHAKEIATHVKEHGGDPYFKPDFK